MKRYGIYEPVAQERPCSVCQKLFRPAFASGCTTRRICSDACKARRNQEKTARWKETHDPEAIKRRAKNKLCIKRYGISLEAYEALMRGAICAICGSDGRGRGGIKLDHHHASGQLREPLCHNCNVSLGLLSENPCILRAAADYLDRHAQ